MVLSTLHTNDAPSAVTRLINIGVEPYLVSAALEGVLAQRLVRKICTNCKEPFDAPSNIRHAVERLAGPVETLYHGRGCKKCRQTGYSGRIGIYELLVPNEEMRDSLNTELSVSQLHRLAGEAGMVGLRQDGMEKVRSGITTADEVLRVTAA